MSSGAADLCTFMFAKYACTYFLSELLHMSLELSKFHLFVLLHLKEFSFSCLNIFISVFASFKNLVDLHSFKILSLGFMTQSELTDFKAIAKC